MKTLIIYDNDGVIIAQQYGDYRIPKEVPYIEAEVPNGKYAVSVNVKTKEVIFNDLEKNEIEIMQDKISILEAENAHMQYAMMMGGLL